MLLDHDTRAPSSQASETELAAFFDSVLGAFEEAEARAGAVRRDVAVGGEPVRLRFAGGALAGPLTRALAHLPAPGGDAPALTVCAWDGASTGCPLPPRAEELVRLLGATWLETREYRGEVRGYNSARFKTAFVGPDLLSLYDAGRALAVYWAPDARALPYYESGAPFRTILHWRLGGPDRQVVHAGAVGTPEGGALLVGPGGAGKSTTTLACLGSGLGYLGDDYALVSLGATPTASSLYNTGKVKALADLDRLPRLAGWVCNRDKVATDGEKPMLFVHEHLPGAVVTHFPVKALLVPSVAGGGGCRAVPLSPGDAFKALAPSTIEQLPGAGATSLRVLLGLVKAVPSFRLETGRDLSAIPGTIAALLAGR